MKTIHKTFALVGCCLAVSLASALPVLSVTPSSETVGIGQSANFEIKVSGLMANEVLTIYEFSLRYDPALLAVASATQSPVLDDGASGHFGFIDLSQPGLIGFSDITNSFDFAALKAAQGNSFTLAAFSLSGLAAGTSLLEFMPLLTAASGILGLESNRSGNELIFGATNAWIPMQATAGAIGSAQIVIGSGTGGGVPIPAQWLLLAIGGWLLRGQLRSATKGAAGHCNY